MDKELDLTSRGRAVAVSVAAGILLAVLVRVNATLGTYVGELTATFVVHGVGTAFALALVARRLDEAFWARLADAPAVDWTGGVWSVAMVWVATLVVPHLGTALAVSLFIASDLVFSAATDRAGLLGLPQVRLSPRRVAGLVLAILGVLLVRFG